ncbi:M20/M25/M40 family metallo-hydrolase [Brachybacterium muris]|uniref:M20/M25/M40 family metallo-hydrolase n=1 Tax=Brachybacterium muris TaxID=219301 RepID=UPI0030B8190C
MRSRAVPREPHFETIAEYPVTDNDPAATAAVRSALVDHFGEDRVEQMEPATASEDFSIIPDAFGVPYCYWGFGGYAEGSEVLPNHSPKWAPDLQPTLRTGTEAAAAAILGLLANGV